MNLDEVGITVMGEDGVELGCDSDANVAAWMMDNTNKNSITKRRADCGMIKLQFTIKRVEKNSPYNRMGSQEISNLSDEILINQQNGNMKKKDIYIKYTWLL